MAEEKFIPIGIIKGEKGEKGDVGSGLKIIDYYATIEELSSAVSNPTVGDAYGVGSAAPYDIYIYSANGGWVNNGALAPDIDEMSPHYAEPTELENISSGEKISIAFGKIKKAITELISHIGNKSNPHNVTASDVGAIAQTIYLENEDVLEIVEAGLYYGVQMANVPTTNNAGYIRVVTSVRNDKYREVCWRPNNSIKEYVNVCHNGEWLGWTEIFTNKGGTLTGELGLTLGGGNAAISTGATYTSIRGYKGDDSPNRRELYLGHDNDTENMLQLHKYTDGVKTEYNIFGEHNKPSSTYRGNGSAEGITVNIGGKGKALLLYGSGILDDSPFIVTRSGAFGKGGSTCLAFSRDVINFTGGVLTIKTDSPYFNADSTYAYRVL